LGEYLGVGSPYAKVADCFSRILGLELSTQAISDLVAEDAGDVETFYAQQPPPPPASEAALLVVQADGKGVPMVRATPKWLSFARDSLALCERDLTVKSVSRLSRPNAGESRRD
jgi:hypothetical protein